MQQDAVDGADLGHGSHGGAELDSFFGGLASGSHFARPWGLHCCTLCALCGAT